MVIDTSALVAIMTHETSADRLVVAVEADRTRLVSGATVVGASVSCSGEALLFLGDDFSKTDVEVCPW